MARIVETDLTERFAARLPRWATSVLVGLGCAGAMGVIRFALDVFAEGAAPFALIFPAIMVATLAGRSLAGVVTSVLSVGYALGWVMPTEGPYATRGEVSVPTAIVVAIAAALTIALAELFRRTAQSAAAARDREIAERDLFLAEFEHRVKNNLATVQGLLELQRRRAEPATALALSAALARVESIARAHRHLYRGALGGTVEMRDYLTELCAALAQALAMGDRIAIRCESDAAAMPRDRAVSIGLIVNELVTNAAKHAFAGRERGQVEVRFATIAGGWRLSVADDGIGMPAGARVAPGESGLGTRLIDAFARQAGGTVSVESGAGGTCTLVTIEH